MKNLNAYRACTTYEAFNVFWEPKDNRDWSPSESTPVKMLMSKDDVIEFADLRGVKARFLN